MPIFDRYVAKEILLPFSAGLLFLTQLLLATQVLNQADVLFGSGVSFVDIAWIVGALVPNVLGYVLPISFLLGAVIGIGRLSEDREIVAMGAAGLSTARLVRVPVAIGLVVAAVAVWFSTHVEPAGFAFARMRLSEVVKRNVAHDVQAGTFYDQIPGYTLYAEKVHGGGVLVGVRLLAVQLAGVEDEPHLLPRPHRLEPAAPGEGEHRPPRVGAVADEDVLPSAAPHLLGVERVVGDLVVEGAGADVVRDVPLHHLAEPLPGQREAGRLDLRREPDPDDGDQEPERQGHPHQARGGEARRAHGDHLAVLREPADADHRPEQEGDGQDVAEDVGDEREDDPGDVGERDARAEEDVRLGQDLRREQQLGEEQEARQEREQDLLRDVPVEDRQATPSTPSRSRASPAARRPSPRPRPPSSCAGRGPSRRPSGPPGR